MALVSLVAACLFEWRVEEHRLRNERGPSRKLRRIIFGLTGGVFGLLGLSLLTLGITSADDRMMILFGAPILWLTLSAARDFKKRDGVDSRP